MKDIDFDQHSEQSVHFFSRKIPRILDKWLRQSNLKQSIVDVGCGDGQLLWSLSENGRISRESQVIGVDISPIRLRRFEKLTGFTGVLGDGHLLPLIGSGTVDVALSTMVIEHIPDDLGHLLEASRIVRDGGMLYLTTVIRKRGAWYFRKSSDGRRVLDPTHLREYSSVEEVTRLVEQAGFRLQEQKLTRLWFPIIYPFVRWIHAVRPINGVQRMFLERPARWLVYLALPIPRYRAIEIIAQRTDAPHASLVAAVRTGKDET